MPGNARGCCGRYHGYKASLLFVAKQSQLFLPALCEGANVQARRAFVGWARRAFVGWVRADSRSSRVTFRLQFFVQRLFLSCRHDNQEVRREAFKALDGWLRHVCASLVKVTPFLLSCYPH